MTLTYIHIGHEPDLEKCGCCNIASTTTQNAIQATQPSSTKPPKALYNHHIHHPSGRPQHQNARTRCQIWKSGDSIIKFAVFSMKSLTSTHLLCNCPSMESVWLNDSQIGYPYFVSIKNSLDIRLNTQILEYIAPKNVLQIKNVCWRKWMWTNLQDIYYIMYKMPQMAKKDQYW